MTHELTGDDVFDSLTGHDEFAIAQHFGMNVGALVGDQTMLTRALVFVLKRRDGMNDDDARNVALEMTLKEAQGYFAKEESEESGKDETSTESSPDSSPSGAFKQGAPETST